MKNSISPDTAHFKFFKNYIRFQGRMQFGETPLIPAASVYIPALKLEKGKEFHQALGPTVPKNTYYSQREQEGHCAFPKQLLLT